MPPKSSPKNLKTIVNKDVKKIMDNRQPKDSLPNGWVIRKSKKYPDKVYYFNYSTGVSTWEFPNVHHCQKLNNKSDVSVKLTKSNRVSSLDNSKIKVIDKKGKKYNASLPKMSVKNKGSLENSNKFNQISYGDSSKKSGTWSTVDSNSTNRNFTCTQEKTKISKKKKKSQPVQNTDCFQTLKKNDNESISNIQKIFSTIGEKSNCVRNDKLKTTSKKNKNLITKKITENTTCVPENNLKSEQFIDSVNQKNLDDVEDIDMLDISDDLIKIDELNDKIEDYYIVIDTNILVSEIQFIDEIKDIAIFNCGPPHIFIPWIVIQELDHLKTRSSVISKLYKGAMKAMKYINHMIKSKHPRFHGQSPKEMKNCAQKFSINNDDRILECCLSLAKKLPVEKIILLTNDINLSNKALICNIGVYDLKSFLKLIKVDNNNLNLNNSNKIEKDNNNVTDIYVEKKQINEIMIQVRESLKTLLYHFLESEMLEAYGEVWRAFKIEINTLKGILNAIEKYWRTVFSFSFKMRDKSNFDLLMKIANRPEGFICTKEESKVVLTAIEAVFYCIKKRWPKLDIPFEKIQTFQTCLNKSTKIESIPKIVEVRLSGDDIVLKVFEHDWTVLNHLCGMIMDFYGIPHNFCYDKPTIFPSESEFNCLIEKLYPAVCELKKLLHSIISKDCKNIVLGDKVYTECHALLKNFVPSLQIGIQPIDTNNFTVNSFQNFCNFSPNQEKLMLGYKQLENFYFKLDEVLIAIMLKKSSTEMICD